MTRIESSHRYDVSVEREFAFITSTENWEFLAGLRTTRARIELG